MGMRVGEILGMHWSRIDLKKNFLVLTEDDTKTGNGRVCALSPDVARLLAKRTDRSGFLFKSPQDPHKCVGRGGNKTAWQHCKKLAGVKGRFHDLRATFLTKALTNSKGKVNITLICKFAGLSTKVAERHYIKPSSNDTKVVSQLVKID
jgi:integrase